MSWYAYRLEYELLSPLHVGYRRVSNVQRTRYYVPARNLWGATTERLTRAELTLAPDAPRGDYERVGEWLRTHCAFGYLFVCHNGRLLCPWYSRDGLRYGGLESKDEAADGCGGWTESEFERHYLAAHVTTALDPASTSAQAEGLHEVEYIAPHDRGGRRTRMGGWVWLDDVARERLGGEGWREWPAEFQVGGERRYGFGRLRLCQGPVEADRLLPGYVCNCSADRPILHIDEGKPLLSHVLVDDVSAQGMIEPLVGRETGRNSERFGQRLTRAGLTWVPGSVAQHAQTLMVDEWGMWCSVPGGRA